MLFRTTISREDSPDLQFIPETRVAEIIETTAKIPGVRGAELFAAVLRATFEVLRQLDSTTHSRYTCTPF